MGPWRFLISRGGQYAIVLAVAISLNFVLPRLMPGSPLALLAGVEPSELTPEEREELISEAGLDQPMIVQYFRYWGNVLTFNFGTSFRMNEAIGDLILERLPWTLLITMTALLLSSLIGIALGVLAAWRRGRASDVVSLNTMIALDSTPSFWLGMLFVALFSVTLGWLPSYGAVTPGAQLAPWDAFVDIAAHAALPILTLTILSIPGIFLTMRYSTLSVMGEDFIRTAQAKGLTNTQVLSRHVVRNAIVPVSTVIALRLGFAFGGSVVIETVFSYPGLGRLVFEAVSSRDYPVMQATFLVFTIAVLVANILADLLYPRLDPRTRT
ncbi:ABC transporter permease [Agrococcus lahaulensis]|nr:ABC transporter permease [Agrococcus lahaulensis]